MGGGVVSGAGEWVTFTIPGEPVSKARARFTGYGGKVRAYTPTKTLDGEKSVAAAFRAAGGRFESDREVTFEVAATFHNGTRQRRDVDNMLKLILDGLNGVAWVDDTQVMNIAGRKCFVERADARTEVALRPIGRMDRITKACEWCEVEFTTYPSLKGQRFCSRECRTESRRVARARTCERCGVEFLAHGPSRATRFCSRGCADREGRIDIPCGVCGTSFIQFQSWANQGRIYCSTECSAENARARSRERRSKKFPGTCAICGSGTTRKEYVRCNPCKLAGKATLPRPRAAG